MWLQGSRPLRNPPPTACVESQGDGYRSGGQISAIARALKRVLWTLVLYWSRRAFQSRRLYLYILSGFVVRLGSVVDAEAVRSAVPLNNIRGGRLWVAASEGGRKAPLTPVRELLPFATIFVWHEAMSEMSLKLPNQLKQRVQSLVTGTGRTAHPFMVEAIERAA